MEKAREILNSKAPWSIDSHSHRQSYYVVEYEDAIAAMEEFANHKNTPEWKPVGHESFRFLTDTSLILFDDGSIHKYADEWPRAIATHFFIVPNPTAQ